MKRVMISCIGVGFTLLCVNPLHSTMLVRIHNPSPHELPRALDIAGQKRGEWIDVVVDQYELADLAHLKTEVVIEDLESFYAARKGEYHDYTDFVNQMVLVATVFPDIAILDTLGVTYEGREVLALKISDNVDVQEDEPELLFVGLHHAREWPSLEICLFLVDTLTWGYGSDPSITDVVNTRQIWIVPCLNPDGYVYCHDEGHDWRKNRRYFPQFDTTGVDLNRNYDGSNDGHPGGEWGSIPGGTSHGPHTEVYCGPSPFSEAETQALRNLILQHDFVFGVSYHTWQESVMWQWGYTTDPAEDSMIMSEVGEEMASRITRQYGAGTYDAYQSSIGLYYTAGDYGDWHYGFTLYADGKNTLAYTVEACASFHPSTSYLDQIVRENFDGAFYLCQIADSISSLLTPRVMPPQLTNTDTISASYALVWLQTNPSASPDYYALQELTALSVMTDDGESGDTLWYRRYFTIDGSTYHSPDHSYFSSLSRANDVSALTARWPLLVDAGDSLTFWCRYDIEENWDYAFVEVSLDTRRWEILGAFTGASDWTREAYTLEPYAGNSLFIRFRYITDDAIQYAGFWVDDIHPVASFGTSETLDSAITDTAYVIDYRPAGHYYYRVRGHNDERGWGDWSQLEHVVATSVWEHEVASDPGSVYLIHRGSTPFRSATVIEYYVPDRCEVSLDMYNLVGGHVATLQKSQVEKGVHRISCTASLPPGVYFCQLRSPFGSRTIKLLRLR